MIINEKLEKEKREILLSEISRKLPYKTLALYNLPLNSMKNLIGEIIKVDLDSGGIVTLKRKIDCGNVYERVFVDDVTPILKSIKELPDKFNLETLKNLDRDHIDVYGLINMGLAIEDSNYYDESIQKY